MQCTTFTNSLSLREISWVLTWRPFKSWWIKMMVGFGQPWRKSKSWTCNSSILQRLHKIGCHSHCHTYRQGSISLIPTSTFIHENWSAACANYILIVRIWNTAGVSFTASDNMHCHFTLRQSIRLALLPLYVDRLHPIGSTVTLHYGTASNWLHCHFTLSDSIQLALPSLYIKGQHPIGSTVTLRWVTASNWVYQHIMLRDSIWKALLPLYVERRHLIGTNANATLRWETAADALLPLYVDRQHPIDPIATLHWETASNWLYCHFHIAKQNLLSCTATFKPTDRNGTLHCRFHSYTYQQICIHTTCNWRIPNFGTAHLLILS